MVALSESAWTNAENKDYNRFRNTLPNIFNCMGELELYYFNSLNDTLRSEPSLANE